MLLCEECFEHFELIPLRTNEDLEHFLVDDLFALRQFLQESVEVVVPTLECFGILDYFCFVVGGEGAASYSYDGQYKRLPNLSQNLCMNRYTSTSHLISENFRLIS